MDALLFALVWLAHTSVLGGLALVLPRIVGMSSPRWLAGWWAAAAGTVVLLPVAVAWYVPRGSGAGAEPIASAISSIVAVVPSSPPSSGGVNWWALAGGVWLVGVLARLAWLMVGHRRLRAARCGDAVPGRRQGQDRRDPDAAALLLQGGVG